MPPRDDDGRAVVPTALYPGRPRLLAFGYGLNASLAFGCGLNEWSLLASQMLVLLCQRPCLIAVELTHLDLDRFRMFPG